jgi:hypothetical protein
MEKYEVNLCGLSISWTTDWSEHFDWTGALVFRNAFDELYHSYDAFLCKLDISTYARVKFAQCGPRWFIAHMFHFIVEEKSHCFKADFKERLEHYLERTTDEFRLSKFKLLAPIHKQLILALTVMNQIKFEGCEVTREEFVKMLDILTGDNNYFSAWSDLVKNTEYQKAIS